MIAIKGLALLLIVGVIIIIGGACWHLAFKYYKEYNLALREHKEEINILRQKLKEKLT